jgi:hypothetical protein
VSEELGKEIAGEILNDLFRVLGNLLKAKSNLAPTDYPDNGRELDRLIGECFDFWGFVWAKERLKQFSEDAYKLLKRRWDNIVHKSVLIQSSPFDTRNMDEFYKALIELRADLESL